MICAIVIGVQTCALPILAPGEMTVVFGDSGIGKSCLVDVLSGMMAPAGFEADISGQEIDFDEYRALVGKSAYVSQQVRPWHASVRDRSEEHTSELQSLMRISYAVFCLKKKTKMRHNNTRFVEREV